MISMWFSRRENQKRREPVKIKRSDYLMCENDLDPKKMVERYKLNNDDF